MPNWGVVGRIVEGIILLVIGAFVKDWFDRRPRLIRYVLHPSSVMVRPPQGQHQLVNVHALVVKNVWRGPAKNVRIGHNLLPDFSVYPDTQYTVENLPGGGKEIVIPLLASGQDVLVQYLYFPPVLWTNINTHVQSDEMSAKTINIWHVQKYSAPVNALIVVLMLIGVVTICYLVWLFSSRAM